MHRVLFVESWKNFKNNLELLVPALLHYLFVYVISFLLIYSTGLISFFELASAAKDVDFVKIIIPKFATFLILILIANLFISAYFTAMKFGMITEVIKKKKTSLTNGFISGKKNYLRMLGLEILISLIVVIPILLLIIIFLLKPSLLTGLVLALVGIAYLIFIIFATLFSHAILFLDNVGPFKAIKKSFKYFKKKAGYVLAIVVILFLTGLILGIISGIISLIPIIGGLISLIIFLAIIVWADIFRFKAYFKKRI